MELAASLQLSSAARGILQMNPGPSSSFRKLLQPITMEVPPNETRYFDQNVAVILAAMLCAVISALGLASMVRCALRCGRRGREPDAPSHVTVRLATAGLEKAAIKALPTAVFAGASPSLPKARPADCPICLAEFAEGETVRVLPPCCHCFHVDCIDTWLLCHTSCPSCRHSLLNVQAADGAGNNSWVVAIHQSSVAGGAEEASIHVEKPRAALQGLPRESPHRFLP